MRVVVAVVLYNINIDQSSTLLSLVSGLRSVPEFGCHVLVFDNSEQSSHDVPKDLPNCTIVWSGQNRGLAKSYNDALAFCESHGAQVLVTLDQDSKVTTAYLEALVSGIDQMREPVVALCPKVVSRDRLISPFSVSRLGRRSYGGAGPGIAAINSFSAYSVGFLRSIGGFEEFYWLDGLDLSTYARIVRCGKSVGTIGAQVEHELSLLTGVVGAERLKNIAYYEASYLFQYGGALQAIVGMARLLARAIRVAPRGSRLRYLFYVAIAAVRGAIAGAYRRTSGARTSES
jgi:GT2 family glycosyltransferase